MTHDAGSFGGSNDNVTSRAAAPITQVTKPNGRMGARGSSSSWTGSHDTSENSRASPSRASDRRCFPVFDVEGHPIHTFSSRWPCLGATPYPALVAFDEPIRAAIHSVLSRRSNFAWRLRGSW